MTLQFDSTTTTTVTTEKTTPKASTNGQTKTNTSTSYFKTTTTTTNAPIPREDTHPQLKPNTNTFETASYICLILSVAIPVSLIILGAVYHRRSSFAGCDTPNYLALFVCFWNMGDFYSDLIFCIILSFEYDLLFWMSLIFVLIPYISTIAVGLNQIRKLSQNIDEIDYNEHSDEGKTDVSGSASVAGGVTVGENMTQTANSNHRGRVAHGKEDYIERYGNLMIAMTVFCGFYSTIQMMRSNIFYMEAFSLQLKYDAYLTIQSYRFVTTVLIELSLILFFVLFFVSFFVCCDNNFIIYMHVYRLFFK